MGNESHVKGERNRCMIASIQFKEVKWGQRAVQTETHSCAQAVSGDSQPSVTHVSGDRTLFWMPEAAAYSHAHDT